MSDKRQIDYRGVRRYFAQAGEDTAACASYMAHAQDLPENAVRYRFQKECRAIRDWLDVGGPQARVLDLGCGSGTWTEFFAERFGIVIGIEQSPAMLVAAKTKLTDLSNVELLNQDVREPLPPGPFDLVFLGGICMYLNDADTIALVQAVIERLGDRGRVVLRESTAANGYEHGEGEYHAIYRSVDVYRKLFREAGSSKLRLYLYGDRSRARRTPTPLPAYAAAHVTFPRRFDLVVTTGYFARMLRASSPDGSVASCALAKAPEPFFYARECKLTLWQLQRDLRDNRPMESHAQQAP